jgi:hypothetical protein
VPKILKLLLISGILLVNKEKRYQTYNCFLKKYRFNKKHVFALIFFKKLVKVKVKQSLKKKN